MTYIYYLLDSIWTWLSTFFGHEHGPTLYSSFYRERLVEMSLKKKIICFDFEMKDLT